MARKTSPITGWGKGLGCHHNQNWFLRAQNWNRERFGLKSRKDGESKSYVERKKRSE